MQNLRNAKCWKTHYDIQKHLKMQVNDEILNRTKRWHLESEIWCGEILESCIIDWKCWLGHLCQAGQFSPNFRRNLPEQEYAKWVSKNAEIVGKGHCTCLMTSVVTDGNPCHLFNLHIAFFSYRPTYWISVVICEVRIDHPVTLCSSIHMQIVCYYFVLCISRNIARCIICFI